MRVAVLLGAGASLDAGLKTTYGLAQDLMTRINSPDVRTPIGVPEALNFVYGEMAAHQGAHGQNPLGAVNTERLISAVRLLAARDAHEADPFVASWKTAPGVFSATASYGGAELRSALSRAEHSDNRLPDAGALAWAIRRIASDRHDQIFAQLETVLLESVSAVLSTHKDVSYLRPLLTLASEQEGVDIATLNYDLTVEDAARELAVPVSRGVEDWEPGTPMNFAQERGTVNLYKLHGSIDWEHVSAEEQRDEWHRQHHYRRSFPVVAGRSVRVSESGPVPNPAIIIGDREKLNGEGPTLALIAAFERALTTASHLVVVGYSFTDVHVNALIRSWANADDHRTITVIDPGWPDRYDLTGFRADLIEALRPQRETSAGEPFRLEVVKEEAKTRLRGTLNALTPRPSAPVSLHCTHNGERTELHVTNTYSDVGHVRVSARFPTQDDPHPPRTDIGDNSSFPGPGATHVIGDLKAGETRVTGITSNVDAGTDIVLTVHASDHQDTWDYPVTVAWPGEVTSAG